MTKREWVGHMFGSEKVAIHQSTFRSAFTAELRAKHVFHLLSGFEKVWGSSRICPPKRFRLRRFRLDLDIRTIQMHADMQLKAQVAMQMHEVNALPPHWPLETISRLSAVLSVPFCSLDKVLMAASQVFRSAPLVIPPI